MEIYILYLQAFLLFTDVQPNSAGKLLGEGKFGKVYKGNLYGSPVAIKVLNQPINLYEFEVEVGIMGSIRHPNICLFMGACFEPEYCVVMEYLPVNLKQIASSLTFDKILDYAIDIAKGMAWLHSRFDYLFLSLSRSVFLKIFVR